MQRWNPLCIALSRVALCGGESPNDSVKSNYLTDPIRASTGDSARVVTSYKGYNYELYRSVASVAKADDVVDVATEPL